MIAIVIAIAGITAPATTVNAKTNAPAKAVIKTAMPSKNNKKIVVTVKKIKRVTGYQIAYKKATAKKYTTKKTKKTTYSVPVKKNTTYKIKVRAYKKTGKKTVYGKWSKVMTIKTTTRKHTHDWTTVTDKAAWDEPVYEEQPIYDYMCWWPDGTPCPEMRGGAAKVNWCRQHCVTCFPDCPDPDPQGRCAITILCGSDIVGYERVQTDTIHHPAITHQECKTCGARK